MKTQKKNARKVVAHIGLYGTREIGFAYLTQAAGIAGVTGTYDPTAEKLKHESATDAIFHACDALTRAGVHGLAMVSFDRKVGAYTVVRSAEIDISNPPTFGSIKWTETAL